MKGKFITLEGIEGSGKSVQVELLYKYLKNKKYKVIKTMEPGGTTVGKSMRKVLLEPSNKELTDLAELYLYLADRNQHLQQVIKPNLQKGHIVISDRWADATLVYQGYGRKLSVNMVKKLNETATEGITPILTIVLDVSLDLGLKRAKKIGYKGGDRMERQKKAFHMRVKNGYKRLANDEPKRVKLVNAEASIDEVHDKIIKLVDKVL